MIKERTFSPKTIHKNLRNVGGWSYFFLSEIAFKHYYPWYVGLYEMNMMAALKAMYKYEPDCDKLIKRFQKEVGYHTIFPESFPEGCVNEA